MPIPYNSILSSTHYNIIIIWCEFHHIETAIAGTVIISSKTIITIIILYMYALKYYVLALWPRPQSIISLSTIMLNAFCRLFFLPPNCCCSNALSLSPSICLRFLSYGLAAETGAFRKVFPLFIFISFTLFTRVTLLGATQHFHRQVVRSREDGVERRLLLPWRAAALAGHFVR